MKIEEYLNSLEKKELIYIFLSIPIVVFIIYYNFIYPKLETENKKLSKTLQTKKKALIKVSKQIRVIKKSKVAIIPTRKKLETLKEDFKFITYSFDTLQIIKFDNQKIYNIFTKLLNKANNLKLNVSFNIEWNTKQIPPFNQYISLNIQGDGNYLSIIKYLQFIDHIKSLIFVNNVDISIKNKNDKDLLSSLIAQKNALSNSISFVLTKYSENTLKYFQKFAKQHNLNFSTHINNDNINYLNISFSGNYNGIKALLEYLKNIASSENKVFEFTKLKTKLSKPKTTNDIKREKFDVSLEIMGVK